MPTGTPGNAMSVAERTRRFRVKERQRELQVALAVSRLIIGKDPGDARKSLQRWLEKMLGRADEIPEEYAEEIIRAAERLQRRR